MFIWTVVIHWFAGVHLFFYSYVKYGKRVVARGMGEASCPCFVVPVPKETIHGPFFAKFKNGIDFTESGRISIA
jgi:hypothetical protein